MKVCVTDVLKWIDEFAPFEQAEEWDNVGLLAGAPSQLAERVLCALELNSGVLEEAQQLNAQLIVTHHPILFHARKNLREDDAEGRMLCTLVRSHIALIAAHTNFDNNRPGVNDALAEALGLKDVRAHENGMRTGVSDEKTLGALRDRAAKQLGGPVRMYGNADTAIHRIALSGGAGGDYAAEARANGADVYLTGEIAHHKAWDSYENGVSVLECGHAATELPAVTLLAEGLQKAADGVKCKIEVFASKVEMFR